MKKPGSQRIGSERGSVILVALGFTAVLAIATTGFITACYRSMQLSNRAFNSARSIQFAEMGMEEALWSLKNNDWSEWTISGSTATRTIGGFAYNDGCSGEIHLRLQNYNTASASLTVEGQTTLADGSAVRKQVVATAAQAPVFTNTIFSLGSTTFDSGGTVDSYNSADGPYDAYTAGFSAIVAGSSGGSATSVSVDVNSAHVKGYVAYGGLAPTFGSSGSLSGPTTPTGVRIDSSRYNTSPWQNLPDIKPVVGGSALPSGSVSIGTPGATVPSVYYTPDLGLDGERTIMIEGPVILDVTGVFYVHGAAKIVVTPTGSLEVHYGGGLNLLKFGIENQTYDPKKVALFGTGSSDDFNEHVFAMTSPFYGVIYSPNAALEIYDWIEIHGAVVAKSTFVVGSPSPQFHYDVSLRNSGATFRGLAPVYQLTNWREITDPGEMAQF